MHCDNTLSDLKDKALQFRNARNWGQFHSLKDLALALSIESSELLELFLWKDDAAIHEMAASPLGQQRLSEEFADILIFLFYLSDKAGIDLATAVVEKIQKNELKYPVEKSYGCSKKYTDL